ncbi:MAG: hypothetical protein ACKOU7_13180 [Ferruginibacter sp.]
MNNQSILEQPILNQAVPSPGIPEAVGVDYTTNYRTYISGIDKNPDYIHAFNIPMQDIASLADFTKCPSVRAYLGMSDPKDISTLKLVLVPVDITNTDILSIQVPDGSGGLVEQSSIYDFTSPCPQNCDIDSPLFS